MSFSFLSLPSVCRKHSTNNSYFLSMFLVILLWFKRFTLAMVAGRREAAACSPGDTVWLSNYRCADTRESVNLPYQIRSWKCEYFSLSLLNVIIHVMRYILLYQVAYCGMASTMCLPILIQRSVHSFSLVSPYIKQKSIQHRASIFAPWTKWDFLTCSA